MKRRKRKNKIIILGIFLLLIMTVGYAAFQTNINITAKGNIKDLQKEVDAQVPTNELLFWGQANNHENTLTTLKDKSGNNNDGILYNFDNSGSSGYKNNELIFDGINDYADIGFKEYDFQNSISYVIYAKINTLKNWQSVFGNWEGNGGGLEIDGDGHFRISAYNGSEYIVLSSDFKLDTSKYYTLIGTYDGATLKLYVDGKLVSSAEVTQMTTSPVPVYIGANPYYNVNATTNFTDMSFKEAMLYDRALTSEEVNQITKGFERKYKNS